jgi:hypothetical protein
MTTNANALAHGGRQSVLAAAFVAVAALSACDGPTGGGDARSAPPVPAATLNALYTINGGLLAGLAADGAPITSGPDADPLITEARRFYDTLATPSSEQFPVDYPDPFTGESTTLRKTAPVTLDDWKRVFGFSAREAGESAQDYRDRTGVAIYYNRNELGLGRELGCSPFVDGADENGVAVQGIACYVTNYGPGFRQGQASLQAAIDGTQIRNTVCITHRPTMDPAYQVQFYVYNKEGTRQDWARLDTLGPRPHPLVCMNCHGGAYDQTRHLAKNARFLPLDPNLVVFAEGGGVPAGVTRAGQEERIRVLNQMAMETPLTSAQQAMVSGLYGGGLAASGSATVTDSAPEAWTTTDEDRDFYRAVIKPYCATCHLAAQRGLADADVGSYKLFGSPAAFDATPVRSYVCGAFSMPNAQPTLLGLWDAEGNPGVVVGGRSFPTAADALLARHGLDRSSCFGFSELSGCNRGDVPDALCGGPVSGGAVCDRDSGRCVPMTSADH